MEADAAEKRVRDAKVIAIFQQKFKGKLLKRQQAAQQEVVDEAFSHVQSQREIVDRCESDIYSLRADLERTKVCKTSSTLTRLRVSDFNCPRNVHP